MRIDRFEVYHVAMPLIYPWRTAYGEDYDIHSVVVRAVSGDYDAWSESSPLRAPTYLTESAASVFHNVTEFFGPHVIGGEYDSADELNERMRVFKGNSFAKAAIEICWWTLQSAMTGTPVHRLLGGETKEVQAGADFGIQDSYDMLLGNIQQAVDAGFPRIKLKVGRGWDLEMLRIVRGAFPDTTFHIDCNSATRWTTCPSSRPSTTWASRSSSSRSTTRTCWTTPSLPSGYGRRSASTSRSSA